MPAKPKKLGDMGREYLYNLRTKQFKSLLKVFKGKQMSMTLNDFVFTRVTQKLELHEIHQSCIEYDRRFLVRQPSGSPIIIIIIIIIINP